MDCVSTADEQKTMLKRGDGRGLKRDILARLKLAIYYQHKKVIHSIMQTYTLHVDTCLWREYIHVFILRSKDCINI